ncbi:MAG: glycosyltransferase [Nitrospirota bacterium]
MNLLFHAIMGNNSILHLIDSGGLYGAEKVVLTLLKELRGSEFQGILGCICESEAERPLIGKEAEAIGIPVQYFVMKRGLDFAGLRKILDFIRSCNIQLVHSHGYKPNILFSLIPIKSFGVICTVHGWSKQSTGIKGKFYEFLDALALKRMDRVIAVSMGVLEDLKRRGLNKNRVSLIYNGINISGDVSHIDPLTVRQKYGIRRDSFIIGSVGRLAKVKGHIYLIEAMPSILRKIPHCQLVIAGEGSLRSELEALIAEQNLSRHVKLIGYVKNIDQFMAMINLFILPSLSEGLPISLLEGLAYGKPVVASHVGGIPEVIRNGSEGVLIPPAAPEAISKAVTGLIENRALTDRMSSAGRELALTKFSSAKMTTAHLTLYSGLIGQ